MRKSPVSPLAPVGSLAARQVAAMAHRRRVLRGRVCLAALFLAAVGVVLAGAVYISTDVMTLRRQLASLEAQRRCADAEGAELLAQWNAATALPVLIERARDELGLEETVEPGLTLLAVSAAEARPQPGRIRRLLGGLGGAETALAAEAPGESGQGAMISLEPRHREAKKERP